MLKKITIKFSLHFFTVLICGVLCCIKLLAYDAGPTEELLRKTSFIKQVDNLPSMMLLFTSVLKKKCKADLPCEKRIESEKIKLMGSVNAKKKMIIENVVKNLNQKFSDKDIQLLQKIYSNPTFQNFNLYVSKDANMLVFEEYLKFQKELNALVDKK